MRSDLSRHIISGVFCAVVMMACETHSSGPVRSELSDLGSSQKIDGVYKLVALQEQSDTLFIPYEGVKILKFFMDSCWSSPAIRKKNKQVINVAGGRYTVDGDTLTEYLGYHLKDTLSVGTSTKYRIKFRGDTLYQSGVYKKGTPDQWKVEEYWIRENKL